MTDLYFEDILPLLRKGHKVSKTTWNGKNMFIFMIKGEWLKPTTDSIITGEYEVQDSIWMKTADGKLTPWAPAQSDVLQKDWVVLDTKKGNFVGVVQCDEFGKPFDSQILRKY